MGPVLLCAAALATPASAPHPAAGRTISVTDLGAKGDGATNNTAHFRAAVATLQAQGGGTLHIPPGNFTTGGFNLTSNMVLRLEEGAVIAGIQPASPEAAVYDFPLVQKLPSFGNGYGHQALVQGWGLTNVTIEGSGTIWGGGDIWWEWFGYPWEGPQRKDRCLHGRPYTIHLHACTGVTLRDAHVMRSPFWTVHLSYSHQILVERLHVVTNDTATGAPALPGRLAQPPATSQPCNADGIDIDSSTHVHVRDSVFWTHDDSIALKSVSVQPPCVSPRRRLKEAACTGHELVRSSRQPPDRARACRELQGREPRRRGGHRLGDVGRREQRHDQRPGHPQSRLRVLDQERAWARRRGARHHVRQGHAAHDRRGRGWPPRDLSRHVL